MKAYISANYRFFLLFFTLLSFHNAEGQISLSWTDSICIETEYTQPFNDALGNTFIQHYTQDTIRLLKYDPAGNRLWDKVVYIDTLIDHDFDQIECFVGPDLNPLISFQLSDWLGNKIQYLMKCDSSGNQNWVVPTNYIAHCVFDIYSNIYFQGSLDSSMNIWKYSPTGVLQFVFSGPYDGGGSWGSLPLVDLSQNVYFYYRDSINKLYKVNPSGIAIDSMFPTQDFRQMRLDNNDNIIVEFIISYRQGPFAPIDSTKSILHKYDSDFSLIWDTGPLQIGGIRFIEFDDHNNIYLLSDDPIISGTSNETIIIKLDNNGATKWLKHMGLNPMGAPYHNQFLFSIDYDNSLVLWSRFYPSGYSGPPYPSTNQILIIKLDSAGILLSQEIYSDQRNLSIFSYFFGLHEGHLRILIAPLIGQSCYNLYEFCMNCPLTFSGYTYFDTDSSCTRDSAEYGIENQIVEVMPGPQYYITDSTGFYNVHSTDTVFTVSSLPTQNYVSTCPASSVGVNIINSVPVNNVNFGRFVNAAINDLQLVEIRGPVRPGMNTLFVLTIINNGGVAQSGSLNFIHDPIFNFVQSSVIPSSISGDTISWILPNILPLKSITIYLELKTTLTPGTVFTNTGFVADFLSDMDLSNNSFIDSGIVTGSLDPNNKTVIPTGLGTQGYITNSDSVLHYQINFENIGTDTAFTVVVIDTLDTNLNIASFKLRGTSHPCKIDLVNSRILYFRFDNIQLPDSSHPSKNYGFINYEIKILPGLLPGIEIRNAADIYFDYNLPVRTAETLNTIVSPTILSELPNPADFAFSPNPVTETLTINSKQISEIKELEIFDLQGKKLNVEFESFADEIKIHFGNYKRGIYVIKVKSAHHSIAKKIIKL